MSAIPTKPPQQKLDGLRIERSAAGLRITRRWRAASGWATLAWAAGWFGLVAFFLSLSHRPLDRMSLALLVLPGIAMSYVAATRFLNCTLIEVRASRLRVRHAPLPWPGGKQLAIDDIERLHAEAKRIHAKGNPHDEYWIQIVHRDGRKTAVLKGLEMQDLETSLIVAALSDYLAVPATGKRD